MGDPLDSYVILRYAGYNLPDRYYNFVKSKWMNSYRYGNDYIKLCYSPSYFAAYSHYIDALMATKANVVVRIAALNSDLDVALGFSVARGNTLDYVHVHKDCRRQGIGKHLVPAGIDTITHLTKVGLKLWPLKLATAKFNPFA